MVALIDITGQKFGHLTVLTRIGRDTTGKTQWVCVCDCGNAKTVTGLNLKTGNSKSCGCRKHPSGSDNPRTITDISRIKERKRSLAVDRRWRAAMLKRYPCCEKCGGVENLQVHHLESYANAPELRTCPNNGRVLCFACHLQFHIRSGRKSGFNTEKYYEFIGKTN